MTEIQFPNEKLDGNIDGFYWAQEFIAAVSSDPQLATNQRSLSYWFCRAIMTGSDWQIKLHTAKQEAINVCSRIKAETPPVAEGDL